MTYDILHDTISVSFVRQLLTEQFPEWATFNIEPVSSSGTDNAIFLLSNNLDNNNTKKMLVRLPNSDQSARYVEKEHRWVPILGKSLENHEIPEILAYGKPSKNYPWNWSVYTWIEGQTATHERIADLSQFARSIGKFVASLQEINSSGGPLSGEQNSFRGVVLRMRDTETRDAIEKLHTILGLERETEFDFDRITDIWNKALEQPVWDKDPVWLHGDLHTGNILVHNGKLRAVIDFGLMGVGDPACDLMVAWTLLSPETRAIFRAELSIDNATWERGRGWALSFALIALAYYINSNQELARISRYTINQVLY